MSDQSSTIVRLPPHIGGGLAKCRRLSLGDAEAALACRLEQEREAASTLDDHLLRIGFRYSALAVVDFSCSKGGDIATLKGSKRSQRCRYSCPRWIS